MLQKLTTHAAIGFVLLAAFQYVSAQPNPDNVMDSGLFDLSLNQLADIRVSVASMDDERIVLTPAITTSYSIQDMRSLGFSNLEEVLSFVPGIMVQDSAIGTKAIMIRGVVEAFNQKVLFLLDGVPYWQASHGGIPLLGLPLEYLDRIEIIRGPGAVFYGSNASSGVVNIITNDHAQSSMTASIGADNGIAGYHHAKLGNASISFGFHEEKQQAFSAEFNNRPVPSFYPSDTPSDTEFDKQTHSRSIWLELNNQHWHSSIHYFSSENDGLAASASTINQSEMQYTGTLFHMEYHHEYALGKGNSYFDINNYYLAIPTDNLISFGESGTQGFAHGGHDNNRFRLGHQVSSALSDSFNLLNGFEVEHRSTGQYRNTDEAGNIASVSMASQSVNEYSLYSQVDKQWNKTRLLGGFRFVSNETSGEIFLPRVSLVQSISSEQSLKLLYSSAFNSPTFIQQYINIPPNVVQGDSTLKPEEIRTLEAAYSIQNQQHLFEVSVYTLETDNFIYRTVNQGGAAIYANTSSFTRQGLDISYRYAQKQYQWFANSAWIKQGNQTHDEDPTALFAPRWTLNMGLQYIHRHWDYGISLRHISERDTAKSLNIVNLQAQYQIGSISYRFIAKNLLSAEMKHPDIQNFQSDQLIQNGPDSAHFNFQIRYQF
ncbi:TonB-dependent receptor [Bermanella marisrubri]|uniref:Outer membrane receptor for ferrienterochelin and colicins n=1 Tax=Bermanella marisrubri TaxID=207949 RepID=Q1MYY5_9GAMM|nr:TonB-dependent receptor [Bermanella marisrubri]EAT11156.1 Outer membrane receptor for ferrienterochelin and colicins [Oceanobacter sp. RED65] [Bermanella marisrubri]QIZ83392.1 TonB-dependent receptor [Bermanella marisrubri]